MPLALRVTTDFALQRLLRSYAEQLGLSTPFADITSKLFLHQDKQTEFWDRFLRNNCAGCAHNPITCRFFNPTQVDCMEGTNPVDVQNANVSLVEAGTVRSCPLFKEDHSERDE